LASLLHHRSETNDRPGPGRTWVLVFWTGLVVGLVLTWFIPFRINPAFWVGIGIIVLGEMVFALGYLAMREHPEKKQAVVDWGIYRMSRHSHVLAGVICVLGMVVAGWNPGSTLYTLFCVYFILYAVMSHFGVLDEERRIIERFGQDYVNYTRRVPRYFLARAPVNR
jgi:protein-S-isoprenylcysteine O-methyltransferase Ste14